MKLTYDYIFSSWASEGCQYLSRYLCTSKQTDNGVFRLIYSITYRQTSNVSHTFAVTYIRGSTEVMAHITLA